MNTQSQGFVCYEVGKSFPHYQNIIPKGSDMGLAMLNHGSFDVAVFLNKPTAQEQKNFKDYLQVHLYEQDHVPFLLMKFGPCEMDCSINMYRFSSDVNVLNNWLASLDNASHFFLVDSSSHVLRHQKMRGMTTAFMATIRTICASQVQAYSSKEEVDAVISRVYNSVPFKTMYFKKQF